MLLSNLVVGSYHLDSPAELPTPSQRHARKPCDISSFYGQHRKPFYLTLCPCPVLTAKGLSSAALLGSRLNKLVTYKPRNLTIVLGSPLPCEKAAGLAANAPKSTVGPCTVLPEPVAPEEPSVCPFPEKEALLFAGPLSADAAAERIAWRRAEGLAPRTVSTTEVPLRTRKVGML